jgi:DnaK suppressor protein
MATTKKTAPKSAKRTKPAARPAASRTVRAPRPGVRPPAPAPARRPAGKAPAAALRKPLPRPTRFSDKDLDQFRRELLALRDRLTGQVARMRQDSLKRDDEVNPEEDGTDAFDRLFALERAGSDQDIIFTIDEAIRAIDEGKYGVCEGCGSLIEKPRLHALPFAKNCIRCQSEMERGRNGSGPRRPLP